MPSGNSTSGNSTRGATRSGTRAGGARSGSAASRRPVKGASAQAAEKVTAHQQWHVGLPFGAEVTLPDPSHLAWYAGVAALAALEIIDWPVAAVLAVGKALADNRHFETLRELGEALDEAG